MSYITYCETCHQKRQEAFVDGCPCCAGLGVAMRCITCDGHGVLITRTRQDALMAKLPPYEMCWTCKGKGWFPISADLFDRLGFGGVNPYPWRDHRKGPTRAT